MQIYSDPVRQDDQYALPDAEVFFRSQRDFIRAGDETWMKNRIIEEMKGVGNNFVAASNLAGWYFWFCLPGCLPDSDAFGPYQTEKEAISELREI